MGNRGRRIDIPGSEDGGSSIKIIYKEIWNPNDIITCPIYPEVYRYEKRYGIASYLTKIGSNILFIHSSLVILYDKRNRSWNNTIYIDESKDDFELVRQLDMIWMQHLL